MPKAHIVYTPQGTQAFTCIVTTRSGTTWSVVGNASAAEPDDHATSHDEANAMMTRLVWSYAVLEHQRRRSRHEATRKASQKSVEGAAKRAIAMAELLDRPIQHRTKTAWCSACFTMSDHVETTTTTLLVTYLCRACGTPTISCTEPSCPHMAAATPQSPGVPRFCAEHRHDIPSFRTLESDLSSLDDVEEWMQFASPNRARQSKVLLGGLGMATVLVPLSLAAAPVLAGALGSSVLGGGLTGAAATSHGLAMLGGGSLAAGGLGMAGGTAVVTAAGAALGGAIGATVTTAYVGADKSFRVERLREGTGPAVVVIAGFLTEGQSGWGSWQTIVDRKYPENPVYRIHWGAKELGSLAGLLGVGGVTQLGLVGLRNAALKASASASTAGVAAVLATADVAKNPWHVARQRATATGAILADLIARIPGQNFVLIGHSLGGRAVISAAEALGTRSLSPRVVDVHLLGAAAGPSSADWRKVSTAVTGTVYNYYSERDAVLKNVYRAAQMGEMAIGANRLVTPVRAIKNRNVSASVPTHADYFLGVKLS